MTVNNSFNTAMNRVVNMTDDRKLCDGLENISQCIKMAYTSADYIGSLVVGTLEKGELGMGNARPTQPAPSSQAVVSPPKNYLKVVNPFAPHQKPKTGE